MPRVWHGYYSAATNALSGRRREASRAPRSSTAMVTVKATMPAMGDGSDGGKVQDAGGGDYTVTTVNFTMSGQWQLAYHAAMGTMIDDCNFQIDVP